MATHIIMGTGPCSEEAVTEALRDALTDGDTIAVAWSGSPVPESLGAVYDYILDHNIDFVLFYTDEQKVHSDFREADHGIVQKVRNPNASLMKALDGNVLFLWNDEEEDLINFVFDTEPDAKVLELSNGLAPISVSENIPEVEMPTPVIEEEEDDYSYTREELETATAYVVKRYGERMGCEAKTKAGIIAELFPEDDAPVTEEAPAILPVAEEPAPPKESSAELDSVIESGLLAGLDSVIASFFDHAPETPDTAMARLKLHEARIWVTRVIEGR
jgi:hypothetical protein